MGKFKEIDRQRQEVEEVMNINEHDIIHIPVYYSIGEEVDFDYFDDPYLTAKPDNVAKHIDRYETADTASTCKDNTMKIHVSHDNATWEINWDPTIIVVDE